VDFLHSLGSSEGSSDANPPAECLRPGAEGAPADQAA
jgi:hypothetical protein